jgi:uridine monophosphate synthetase
MAEANDDFVIGFISQKRLSDNPALLHMAPGIKIAESGSLMSDTLGQQYTTPEVSIVEHKCDIVIVGRAIISSESPAEEAVRYQKLAYDSYLSRLKL